MKKNLFFIIFALAICACNKQVTPVNPSNSSIQAETEMTVLTVNVSQDTKALPSNTQDSKINNLQVFIFGEDGSYENKQSSSSSSLQISSLTGNKKIWALVNAPSLTFASENALKAAVSDLSNNSLTSLVMAGYTSATISGENQAVGINVDRFATKISLKNVTVKFAGTALEGKAFVVKEIYLKNVAGSINYGGTSAPSVWYNKITDQEDAAVDALLSDKSLNISCGENTPVNLNRTWFVYPNPTSDDTDSDTWAPRHTRLVINATIDGEFNSYPFTLPVLERNHSYDITSVVITMKGKPDDTHDDLPKGLTMNVSVNPWTAGSDITYQF